ncbi:MAG: fructose-1,6-bisphosphate aldolase, class II [Candidatus Reconcilbacillus cellulovorans]|uniref:Fructose-1,6-bisphosphate aldolase, class II n=1 Tax=Candidatus Reconcilbacillus cellulovorans TaxID=1906605 RepID=A0A2A6E0Y3_9BACL|nr:MAG: fructose-1,6-bisphosphate aldolase, class II [Candidatus Reconcilbacillus cellulovorans]
MVALVPLNAMLTKALEGGYAVGQFTLNNLEFAQAILLGAQEEEAPVILGVSPSYVPYMGGFRCIASMVRALIDHFRITVPVALHLDHAPSYELCLQALRSGFTSVMIDASRQPLDRNIDITRQVVLAAHAVGASAEAEVGLIAGREDDIAVDDAEASYASADECARLAAETGVDCLAPAVGSAHGPYRGKPKLGFDRLREIRARTGLPLVLHGASGLPDEDVRRAISLGVAKINVNTDNQIAFTESVRRYLAEHPDVYDPRAYLSAAKEAVQATVRAKIRLFGCSGKAGGHAT